MDSRVEEVSYVDSEPNPFRRSRFVDSSHVLHCSCAKAASVFASLSEYYRLIISLEYLFNYI